MPKLSKNRAKVDEVVDSTRKYTVEEACALVKKGEVRQVRRDGRPRRSLGRQSQAR